MRTKLLVLIIYICTFIPTSWGSEPEKLNPEPSQKYYYTILEREHSWKEDLAHLAALYAISWPLYYITQTDIFINNGSTTNYKNNLGTIVFDKDEPIWNWVGHPISGSQTYLYYRANGYTKLDAFKMTFIQSALFEFLIEIYTEPASIQDLYQTPVLGTLTGLVIENVSLYLLNSQFIFARAIGHIINPSTLFWFYEGKVLITPDYDPKTKKAGINLVMDF